MRKVIKIILGIVSVIAAPIVIDFCVFGNTFPSNIDNQTWAGFLGGYLGGIATLVAVFITISDNNKKMEMQRKLEKEQLEEMDLENLLNGIKISILTPGICFLMRSRNSGLMTECLI